MLKKLSMRNQSYLTLEAKVKIGKLFDEIISTIESRQINIIQYAAHHIKHKLNIIFRKQSRTTKTTNFKYNTNLKK